MEWELWTEQAALLFLGFEAHLNIELIDIFPMASSKHLPKSLGDSAVAMRVLRYLTMSFCACLSNFFKSFRA